MFDKLVSDTLERSTDCIRLSLFPDSSMFDKLDSDTLERSTDCIDSTVVELSVRYLN